MAVPKRRHSTTRRNKRRSHDSITLPNPTACPQCGEAKMPHRVCPSCGTYKGRQALKAEE
ncbi:MAG: 50S ribosomal protein L32 [Proteobacteria bacterium]|nr:50S ribosomal protein L32 [Pseudomonadota bacterium]MBU1452871.1 50S ribosomal protein L32 [Pseudomonadota bacterium]MBU2469763.1 50S ribosomal protein L32 [Pseudomonadota bacterium]MBU2516810.1 50S ribosomal protein L32 [Pseudomonadota bacterium]